MHPYNQKPHFQKSILASIVPLLVFCAAGKGHAQPML
jgi:hypothetical protein